MTYSLYRFASLFSLLLYFNGFLNAQEYSVDKIADSLKENAHCVIRHASEELTITGINTGIRKVKTVITVLDKNGDKYSEISLYYDNNSTIKNLNITIYNKNGEKIKKIKQSDILDAPAYSDAALYSDSRQKFYKPSYVEYPYTIEYEYIEDCVNLISYCNWIPVNEYNVSIENTSLTLICPAEIKYRTKLINFEGAHNLKTNGGNVTEEWKITAFRAIEYEPFGIPDITKVLIMPLVFSYGKTKGSAENWNDFVKWKYSLYSGKDALSPDEQTKIKALISGCDDTLKIIRKLYEYVQNRTRYVGIQVDLGGWEPFSAKTVYETGYGDCKALSNYMFSLLRYCGIISFPAIVAAGEYKEPICTDFPSFTQTNHVILCVPYKRDTLWLECTNQQMPFGFLGDFTDDREVMLITEQGGKWAHTKKYSAEDNVRSCRAEFVIDSTGSANASITTSVKGLQYDDIFDFLFSNYDEQKKWLYKNIGLPSLKVNDFSIKNNKTILPSSEIRTSVVTQNMCSFAGKYMVLPFNLINRQQPIQKMLTKRKCDIYILKSSIDYDTLIYKIPAGYKVESLVPAKSLNSDFGEYSCSVTSDNDKIIFSRKFLIKEGRYPATKYSSLYDFILAVSKADQLKIMLTKN
jgi:hypothetical protein